MPRVACRWLLVLILATAGCAGPSAGGRASLPPCAPIGEGSAEFRFENTQYFPVTAGVRAEGRGADLRVPAGGRATLRVPPGSYLLYFIFGNTPDHVRHDDRFRLSVAEGKPTTVTLATPLPPCAKFLVGGRNTVIVRNTNAFSVDVALRSPAGGADLWVPPSGEATAQLPDGTYTAYFVYATEPAGLYQGDSFTLAGHVTTIDLVRVVNGNYGIRKIR